MTNRGVVHGMGRCGMDQCSMRLAIGKAKGVVHGMGRVWCGSVVNETRNRQGPGEWCMAWAGVVGISCE